MFIGSHALADVAEELLAEPGSVEHFYMVGLPSVMARAWMSWSLAELGEFGEATSISEEAMRIAEECDHPFSITIATSCGVGRLYLLSGRFDEAVVVLEHALELCRRWSLTLPLPWTAACLGHAYALSGRLAEAVPLLEDAVRKAASTSSR